MYVCKKQIKGFEYKYGNVFKDIETRKIIMDKLSGWSNINPINECGNYKSIATLLFELWDEVETMAKSYKNYEEGI